MPELWIPRIEENPDNTKLFNMMVLYQDELDRLGYGPDLACAKLGVQTLAQCLERMPEEARQVSVVTDFMVVKEDEPNTFAIVNRGIGVQGTLRDVNCGRFGSDLPRLNYMLEIDAVSAFPPADPGDADMILKSVQAPISRVHYVESAA